MTGQETPQTRPDVYAVSGRVLDAPALLDLANGTSQYMAALAYLATIRGHVLAVPTLAIAEAARLLDAESADRLRWTLRTAAVVVVALDEQAAFAAGEAARQFGQDTTHPAHCNLVMGQVSATAAARRWAIVTTSDFAEAYRKAGHRIYVLP